MGVYSWYWPVRVPIIYYKVNRSVGPHRPHDYLEDRDMGNMEQIPLDDDMIERAGATLNDLLGHHLKQGVNNPYIDVDDYVKRLCRLYAEQALNAAFHGAFHGAAKMQMWTPEQLRKFARQQSKGQHPSNGGK